MQKISFINSLGESVLFGDAAPRAFCSAAGLSAPDVDVTRMQAPGQDGYTLNSLLLKRRIIKVTGHLQGPDDFTMYSLRKETASVCGASLGPGTLVYENDAGKWRIPAFAGEITYGEARGSIQTIEITFEAPSPFWLSEKEHEVKFSYVDGGMSFPLSFPAYFGTLGYMSVIKNDGNVYVPIALTISGGGVNPALINRTTGQKIQISREFRPDDRLIINTDPDDISVRIETVNAETNEPDSENAFGYLTGDSELFTLAPGDNEIIFFTDDSNKTMSVSVAYSDRYAGV